MADLVTQAYLQACLPALNAGQEAVLPQLAAAASRAVRKWCNRQFTRQTFDALFTVGVNQTLLLDEFPVNQVLRLATDPTPVITFGNADAATNQRATAELATAGDADAGLTATGLTLARYASGVAIPTQLAFSALGTPTVQGLADAINAAGGGWVASVPSPYGGWPVADFRPPQGSMPAMGPGAASLRIHVTDLPFRLDARTGEVEILGSASGTGDPFDGARAGLFFGGDDFDEARPYCGFNGIRCVYDAGFDAIPEDVQQATVTTVQAMLSDLTIDPRLGSESDGEYNYVINTAFADYGLPKSAKGFLALYKSSRV